MMKIGFMASGGGSNFQAIMDRVQSGELQGVQIKFLITNNSSCGAVEKARCAGVPVYHLSTKTHSTSESLDAAMLDVMNRHEIDLLVLAGYMKKVPDVVLQRLPWKVINIHPALLPSFGGPGHWGHHVHEAVVAAGVRVSGPTVHFVNEEYDTGRIIAQRAVPVYSTDTPGSVSVRVLHEEHQLYWRVIQAFAEGRVQVENGRVYGDL